MWTPTKTKKYGVALYNWRGEIRYGLPLEIGDTVQILEECAGWFRGFSTKNRSIKGIFPASYIYLKPCKIDNEGLFESVIPIEDSVVREVTLVLREWGNIWKRLFVDRETYKFCTLRKVMRELLDWRRQLLTGTLTQDQMRELKLKITSKIDWGNRKLGLDLVPRIGAHMVDPDTMSVVELYHVHVQSTENSQGASARGTMKRKEAQKILTHHLYFCMRDFGHHIGEDTEIYFSLYDSKKAKYISERFLVRISKEGFSNYIEKLHSNCTIFTDLGNADLTCDMWLVAHVMRMGRMLYSDSSKKSSSTSHSVPLHQLFKRPHGCAVLNINEVLSNKDSPQGGSNHEREFTFKVYQGEEKDFHQLHELIIKKQSNKYNPLSGQPNYGIGISLKMLHGELPQVREENPLLFKNISLTKKLGFSDVIMPGDVRNDLYLTLEKGEFERGGKSTGKNIEVTILVLDSEGKVLENCLWGASGMDGANEYQSMIVYHHNSPWWSETIRLAVPIDKFYGSHIRLEYRHCSTRDKTDNKKLFGFSFARLMEAGGATLRDGIHELYIYKCEDRVRLESSSYLQLPSSARDTSVHISSTSSSIGAFSRSSKEAVYVHTLLCSTKLTQNVDLLSLLQWKEHPEMIQEALNRVLRLNGEELVKFLQDVLDALFSMFSTEDGNSTTHSGLVFHVLVSIFSLLEDSKFEHFKPVMDAYIKGHFAAALVYKGLLSSVQHCADWVSSTDKQEPIQKCFRSLEYIFKFIIQSRLLFSRATGGQYEDSFKKDLYSVFTALNKMLAMSSDVILPTQVALLHSISAVYEQLTDVLPVLKITKLATAMLESLPRELPPQLTQAKLTAIRNMVTSKLFTDDESRNLLLSTSCKHLRVHLAHRDELRLCTEILGEILSFLFKQRQAQEQGKVNNCLHHDVEVLCLTTLDMLIQTVLIIIDRSAPVLGCLVACLIGLLQLVDEFHYKRLWEELADRKPKKDFLLRVFLVFRDLVKQEVFSPDWLVIKMVANNVMLNALQELAQPLVFNFLDSRCHFDKQLWGNYFNLAVAFLTQPSLQLEKFSEVKREKIIEKYGDMRVLMGFQILSMWSNLGEHKINFIPSMVGPFLEVTLVPESELRKATLHIFFDMMECEQKYHGNFKQVESELIDKLDILISENKGDDEYRQLFNTMLLDRVQSEDPAWKESGAAFISSVTRLLERLLDYRSVIQGDENRDKRMSCTVNLLNFYKNEINRKEMYLRYIYKLHDLHLPAENYTEAGFTMKLYADQLSWTARTLVSDPHYPGQQEWQRKEQLYHQIIKYFDSGKCWEKGIPLCKELAELYERRLFDYAKLSQILRTQAKFFDNILTQLRPEPEYFRVGFYGLSFPLFVRNKLFVYRGLEYERIGAFTQRLQTEFPSAQILMKNTPPDDTIINSEGQYIQICNVKPIPEDNPLFIEAGTDIPEKIASFYQVNDVRRFQLDRPVHKGPVDKDNEFKSLWIERTVLVTSSSLPGILRWFEVVEKSEKEVAPVQFACETMESVNKELRQLINQYTLDRKRNINPFSMRLQGIIDANVMGGISKYQQAFFTPEFSKQFPEFEDHVYRLKALTVDQIQVLESGLHLHGQLAPSGVQPLHRRLQERFAQLKQGLRDLGPVTSRSRGKSQSDSSQTISIVNTPLPPLPTEKKQLTVCSSETPSNRSSASSSSAYGHLLSTEEQGTDEEDIYSKPMELLERMNGNMHYPSSHRESLTLPPPPPIPQRESRPRSAGYTMTANSDTLARTPTRGGNDYSSLPVMRSSRECLDSDSSPVPRPPKLTHQRSHSKPFSFTPSAAVNTGSPPDAPQLRNSWSESSVEEAPPLPPRGQTPDKRNTSLFIDTGQTPPAPPKRLVKKGSSGVLNIDSVIDISLESSTSEVPESNSDGHDLRDSGYSEFSQTPSSSISNNFNNLSYEDFDLPTHRRVASGDHANIMNISPPTISPRTQSFPAPPPIPPKAVFNPPSTFPSALMTPNSPPDCNVKTPNGTVEQIQHPSFITVENSFGVSVHCGITGSVVENYSVPRLQAQNSDTGDSPS
ncbi:dedicator of cytokinesis protein 3 isoform X2 [Cryptotermes secundus]|uniref:dedicator of cytokinesis protein 3 isoform X2 n=1 Tax=Cryptotermes secundus TaxID=105785 RepID=UPI001454C57E|nr:dedicator of cytokinesis protein 3 isoform X2 [Cryptotermes secundus]